MGADSGTILFRPAYMEGPRLSRACTCRSQ
jgi:hypothetical protein